MPAYIEFKGLEPLMKKVKTIGQMKAVKAALLNAGNDVKGIISEYPDPTAANQPPVPYYIRGRGMQTASGNLLNSEDLADSWAITTRDHGFTVVIGNNVSYAPFVQSKEFQARWMKDIGWKTEVEVMEKETDRVVEWVLKAVKKIIKK